MNVTPLVPKFKQRLTRFIITMREGYDALEEVRGSKGRLEFQGFLELLKGLLVALFGMKRISLVR